jgi:regulator of ribonuclease activity A
VDFKTADLCDKFESLVQVAEPLFRDYGEVASFWGEMVTIRAFEDSALVRETLETDGQQRVLVVDGGASTRYALLGDQMATLAYENAWAGIVINGCIRDSAEVAHIAVGVKALATVPKRSGKEGTGERDVPVDFAGITFSPGGYLFADEDGIIVADRDLSK